MDSPHPSGRFVTASLGKLFDGKILRLTSKLRYRTKPHVISMTGSIVSENIGRFYGGSRHAYTEMEQRIGTIDRRQFAKLHLANRDK